MRRSSFKSLLNRTSMGGGAPAPSVFADYSFVYRPADDQYWIDGDQYDDIADMPGYTATPLQVDDPALVDEDQIFIISITGGNTAGTQFIWTISDVSGNTRFAIFINAGQYNIALTTGGVSNFTAAPAIVAAEVVDLVLVRTAGVWAAHKHDAGVLTPAPTGGGDNGFPPSATTTKLGIGDWIGGTLPFSGTVDGVYIKSGTFANDAAILAAIEEAHEAV